MPTISAATRKLRPCAVAQTDEWKAEGGAIAARRTAGRIDGFSSAKVAGEDYTLRDGSVVIASITSCTNTSNPYVMIGAGLVARKARALGLTRKPWVKTSLAPGIAGRQRIPGGRGPARRPRRHRLQPRRLWLHHLHRQLRPAGARDFHGDRRRRSGRDRRPVGQPQLRRPDLPRCARQLSRLAAAGRRLCPGRRHEHRPDHRAPWAWAPTARSI